jgi:hypothetical protein
MTPRPTLSLGVAIAAVLLSACTGGSPSGPATTLESAESSASPSPTSSANQKYETLLGLRDAAVAAGYPCPFWQQDNKVDNSSASGTCSDSDVFSIYANDVALQAQIAQSKTNAKTLTDAGLSADPTLVGPNWMINMPAKYLGQLHAKLGGTELAQLPDPSATTSEEPTTFDPKPVDFKVGIKIRKKKCFGSAGCNVTYQIKPSYVGDQPLPDNGVIEVTYEVTGDESGPSINTFTVDGEGTAHFDKEEVASTPRSSTKLKGKITDVSYDPEATE